jgi:hypothetical protein
MKELKISVENAKKAYNESDENGKKLLKNLFGEGVFVPQDIKERVKTFEDACNALGEDHKFVREFDSISNEMGDASIDLLSYLKLRIIAAALNEGWEPQFTEDEYRWYPWFWLYTQDEWDRLSAEKKKYGRVLARSYCNGSAYAGVAYAYAYYASSNSNAYCGSRLAFKSEELAEYCGKQFADIWFDFHLGNFGKE